MNNIRNPIKEKKKFKKKFSLILKKNLFEKDSKETCILKIMSAYIHIDRYNKLYHFYYFKIAMFIQKSH